MRNFSIPLMVLLCAAAGAAYAEEPAGAAGDAQTQPPPAAAEAPQSSAPAPAAAAPAPAAHAETPPRAPGGTAVNSAYAQKLAVAVRAHVPANATVGSGTASCSFQVTASGATSGIACKGSSPAHSQLLQKAIAATKAPPPPGGSFSANQAVVFH